ncbi:hypothetical protein H2203_008226 [Taxawa tesnikishii (nom. ined.)]|nr:hypothetical protein H2203_008226 [Dothideales sp. JES 119]
MPVIARQCWRVSRFVQSQSGHLWQPKEPLLFLYPRWFATASGGQDSSVPLHETDSKSDGNPLKPVRDKGSAWRIAVNKDLDENTPASVVSPIDPREKAKNIKDRIQDTKPTYRLVRNLAYQLETRKLNAARKRRLRLNFTDAEDWRTPFRELLENTSSDSKEHGKHIERLSLPEGTRGTYVGDLNELVLETMLLTDCHIQILHIDEQATKGFDSILLSGTPTSIRLAKQRLNNVIDVMSHENLNERGRLETYSVDSVEKARETLVRPLVRAVWNQYQYPDAAHRAEEAVVPATWTVVSFANYVDDLVKSHMSRLTRRNIYDAHGPSIPANQHVHSVTDILVKLFCDPERLPVISPHACRSAIEFLTEHRKFPEARQIFQALDTSTFHFQPSLFHVFMRAASDEQDLHNYAFALRLMLRRNLKPTWETWIPLVNLVASRSNKDARHIAHDMRVKGLLVSPAAKMALAQVFVEHDYSAWIARGNTTSAFFEHYDRAWGGPEWLTPSTANRMLTIKAARGQMNTASRILDELEARGRRATVASLNILLTCCARQGNVAAAMAFTTRLLQSYRGVHCIRPDGTTFRQLFVLTWQRRCYNLLRVVWRYACMAGHIDYRTQSTMETNITQYAPDTSDRAVSRGLTFRANAAKVAVGLAVRVDVKVPASLQHELGDEPARIDEKLLKDLLKKIGAQKKPEWDWREMPDQMLRKRTLQWLVKADMEVVGKLVPVRPLHELLAEAWEKDEDMKAKGTATEASIEWLLDQAVDVPVKRKMEIER